MANSHCVLYTMLMHTKTLYIYSRICECIESKKWYRGESRSTRAHNWVAMCVCLCEWNIMIRIRVRAWNTHTQFNLYCTSTQTGATLHWNSTQTQIHVSNIALCSFYPGLLILLDSQMLLFQYSPYVLQSCSHTHTHALKHMPLQCFIWLNRIHDVYCAGAGAFAF